MPMSAKPSSGGRENYFGCMEAIHYNGDNITNLARRRKVDTSSFVSVQFTYLSLSDRAQQKPVGHHVERFLYVIDLKKQTLLIVYKV